MWNDWAYNIIRVIILVSLIATLLIRHRHSKYPLLQYVAQWLAIFLLIILAYTYKDNFRDAKERILGALMPGYAVSNQEGAVVVYQNNDGHFYIDAEINGTPITLMVDTGASTTVLNRTDAAKLGLLNSSLNYNKIMQTAGGLVPAATVTLQSVQIADVELQNVPAAVSSRDDLDISVAGMSLLKRFSAYQFKQDKLYLYHVKEN